MSTAMATETRRVKVAGNRYNPQVPPGAVYVGRESPYLTRSPYANPHTVGGKRGCRTCGGRSHVRAEAVALYRQHLRDHPELVDQARAELAGKTLACWCDLQDECHADVLLALLRGENP